FVSQMPLNHANKSRIASKKKIKTSRNQIRFGAVHLPLRLPTSPAAAYPEGHAAAALESSQAWTQTIAALRDYLLVGHFLSARFGGGESYSALSMPLAPRKAGRVEQHFDPRLVRKLALQRRPRKRNLGLEPQDARNFQPRPRRSSRLATRSTGIGAS